VSQRTHILCRPIMGEISRKEVERALEAVRWVWREDLLIGCEVNLWPLQGAHSVERGPDLVMRASIAIYAVRIWTVRFWLHVEVSPHFIATTLTC
jgi:hypothetical protein